MITFTPSNDFDRFAFEQLLLSAADSSTPTYIGDVATDPAQFERLCAEGRQRSDVNKSTRGSWKAAHQHTPGQALTVDELGRVCEGAVEAMVGLDAAAVVLDGTDDRPDKTLAGVKFDVKGSAVRPNNTFAVPCWQVENKGYDALVLVQHVAPGHARVWCVKCAPSACWKRMGGVRGKQDFWLIPCPV